MIFSQSRTIIFIDKERIRWAMCKIPSGRVINSLHELPWSEENLKAALSDIDASGSKRVRIVVGEEFSYVTRFRKNKKSQISAEAQALIPENLQGGWDSKEEEDDIVQIMAVQQTLFALLQKELAKTDIQVEVVESESIAVIRLLPSEKNKAAIFVRQDGKIILGAYQGGIILATKNFSSIPSYDQIKEFFDYLSKQRGISLSRVYLQGKNEELENIFQKLGLEISYKSIDPMMGACQKKDIKGKDRDILNISLKKSEKLEKGKIKNPLNTREKVILVAFFCILVVSAIAVYFIQKSRQNNLRISPTTPAAQVLKKN